MILVRDSQPVAISDQEREKWVVHPSPLEIFDVITADSGEHGKNAPGRRVSTAPMLAVELDLEPIAIAGKSRHHPFVDGVEAQRFDIEPNDIVPPRDCRHLKRAQKIKIPRRPRFGFEVRQRNPIDAQSRHQLLGTQRKRRAIIVGQDHEMIAVEVIDEICPHHEMRDHKRPKQNQANPALQGRAGPMRALVTQRRERADNRK